MTEQAEQEFINNSFLSENKEEKIYKSGLFNYYFNSCY